MLGIEQKKGHWIIGQDVSQICCDWLWDLGQISEVQFMCLSAFIWKTPMTKLSDQEELSLL